MRVIEYQRNADWIYWCNMPEVVDFYIYFRDPLPPRPRQVPNQAWDVIFHVPEGGLQNYDAPRTYEWIWMHKIV